VNDLPEALHNETVEAVKPVCFCGERATWWVNAKQTVWSGHVDLHEGFIGMCDRHRLDAKVSQESPSTGESE